MTVATYRLRVAGIEIERDYRRERGGGGAVRTGERGARDRHAAHAGGGERRSLPRARRRRGGFSVRRALPRRRRGHARPAASAARARRRRGGAGEWGAGSAPGVFSCWRAPTFLPCRSAARDPGRARGRASSAVAGHAALRRRRLAAPRPAATSRRSRGSGPGFDSGADRLSITGCSHGKSLLWDGTESQSLARSQRVKEELLLGGIPGRLLREEGCFGTRYGDALPPNAVLVTLERYPGAQLRAGRQTSGSRG